MDFLLACQYLQHIGYNRSAHVLMNVLNKFGLRDKMPGFAEHFIAFFTTSLKNSIIQEHKWLILFIIWHYILNMIKITLDSYF